MQWHFMRQWIIIHNYSCHKMLGKFHLYIGYSGVGMKM
jgi:hypothetical protein